MSQKLKVSVISISFNQEKYVGQALKSMLDQKTDFDYEVIIADDKSTDSTPSIIQQYAKEYPDRLKPIFRSRNLGPASNFIDALKSTKSQYIAICEADDYWTDTTKLQQQVDFLDKNPDFAVCFHPVRVMHQNKPEDDYSFPAETRDFKLNELLHENFIQTNSVMYRRQNYTNMPTNVLPLDWYLHIFHAQFGKIGYLDKEMGVYRRHPGGIWWNSYKNIDKIWLKHGYEHFNLFIEILKLYKDDPTKRKIISDNINKLLRALASVDIKYSENMLKTINNQQPQIISEFAKSQQQLIQDQQATIVKLNHKVASQSTEIDKLSQENKLMKSSRVWKARNKAAKVIGKKVIE